MARDPRDEDSPRRDVLTGLAALVAVALVIGGVVSVLALAAVRVSGLDDATPRATQRPSLYIPSGQPTTGVGPGASPTGVPSHAPSSATPSSSPTPSRRPKAISLQAHPLKAAPGERVTLTGVFPGHEGATLQVQRFEPGGGWSDFPVTTHVVGGQFSTYVITSHVGVNRLRVLDTAGGKASNAVRVTIG